MPELKFSAADTSLAMEEVQRKLGPDALILSTERRDGLIEIVATNDPEKVEEAGRQASEKIRARKEAKLDSAVEGGSVSQEFSKIIDVETAKYEEVIAPNDMDVSPDVIENLTETKQQVFSKSDLVPEFNRISAELQLLIDSAVTLGTEQGNSPTTASKVKGLGFSRKTINKLFKEADVSIEMPDFIKKFTRKIVNGKDKVFDASQIILVCGPEQAGKTVLTNKLSQFLPPLTDGQPNRMISDPLSGDLVSMFDTGVDAGITSLFRKRQDVNLSEDRLIIDYEGSLDVLDAVLFKLKALKEKPTVSVVYALEVGKSYNAVQKLFEMSEIPNCFIALTKMDLLEVSVSELSAIFDLDKKIQFFSGLKTFEDGLDFAKVSVMEDFLTNLVKQEGC
jgi:hypothetical protein